MGLSHFVGFVAIGLLILALLGWLVLGVVPPKGGFPPLDELVGRYPTVTTTPRTKPLTPQRGGNGRDPHNENPPKRREGGHVYNIALEITCRLETRFNRVLLGGVVIIEGDAYELGTQGRLYESINDVKLAIRPIKFKAIPYYAWANREPGPMTVWVPLMDYYDKVVKNQLSLR